MGGRKNLPHQDPNLPHLNSQSPSLSSVGYHMYVHNLVRVSFTNKV